ncbi:MAG: CPBP family intramembrane metalloprotease [Leptolyngbyaceae cyanobacterium SM1_1_3]|nr:CPBP family intramembrane metalloprotease [Leptolyngbyaceae cyanobacterium SM1_1_3]NJO09044.1 CPBP family intramembrane metalloprotease [Leptolyngbyaceae cyanobacterium SL_1_1]
MTLIKRIGLILMTAVVAIAIASSLLNSLSEPQVTTRLQLYQTDLLLQATEWQGEDMGVAPADVQRLQQALLGKEPVQATIKQYSAVKAEAQNNLSQSESKISELLPSDFANASESRPTRLQAAADQQARLIQQLDLRLGLLHAESGDTKAAIATWQDLTTTSGSLGKTADVLAALWQQPPAIKPTAEPLLQENLDGWFRYRALSRLYTLEERPADLNQLQSIEQVVAQKTIVKLALIGTVPIIGCLLGTALLLFVVIQRFISGKSAILAHSSGLTWETPWTAETIWQVLIVGFFFTGQILLPLLLGGLGINALALGSRGRALYAMSYYLLMAAVGIGVLYASLRTYRPLPDGWFRFRWDGNWWKWGLGGYLVALPLMIGVAVVNQRLWQGQGGSNPLLQTVLEESDKVSLLLFFLTASVAAPLFEEVLFRGFLLPSLTRYMPVWGAIALSSFIFAAAHLSLSEVLPLMMLGAILGFVYTRSRSLLAPMLLHSLWNGATMIGLLLLGSAR